MAEVEDPKKKLTTFLSDLEGTDKHDLSTEFPTAEVIQMQLYHRRMALVGVKEADDFANDIAEVMWSFKRGSRREAVLAMAGAGEERPIEAGEVEEEKKEVEE